MSEDAMRLLVAVINDREKLDEMLSGFIELGITGATVVSTEGMGRVLSQDIPVFAGLQSLTGGARPQNYMVLSVLAEAKVAPVVALIQDVTGGLDAPATGIVFTLPVDAVFGLARELEATPEGGGE
jgi:nitrogen regulatory protein PII